MMAVENSLAQKVVKIFILRLNTTEEAKQIEKSLQRP
jgi:hypothetical protein